MSNDRDYADAAAELMTDLKVENTGDYRRHFCGKFTLSVGSANKIMDVLSGSLRAQKTSAPGDGLIRYAMRDYDDGYVGFSFQVIDEEYYRMKAYFIRHADGSDHIVSPLTVEPMILECIRFDKFIQLTEKKVLGGWHYRIEDAAELHLAFAIASCHNVPLFVEYPCLVSADSRKENMEDMPIYNESNLLDALRILSGH